MRVLYIAIGWFNYFTIAVICSFIYTVLTFLHTLWLCVANRTENNRDGTANISASILEQFAVYMFSVFVLYDVTRISISLMFNCI